jgi:hypothetical protein
MKVKTKKIKKLLQDRGYVQYWVGERIGYEGPSGKVQWNRIIHGNARLPEEKVGHLAIILSVPDAKIKKLFGLK